MQPHFQAHVSVIERKGEKLLAKGTLNALYS